MFGTGRIVVIDDEDEYLTQLTGTLHQMGVPCIPIRFTGGIPEDAAWLSGCRIVFCDLHLIAGMANNKRLHFAAIGSLLDKMATNGSSSLLLVLWTSFPQDVVELETYLTDRHAKSLPAAILSLDKKDFAGEHGTKLPDAVRAKLQEIPQLRALYEWQDDVSVAATACVGSLVGLARSSKGSMNDNLDKVLSALAQKATGLEIAAEQPGAALQEILSALLNDRLSHFPEDAQHGELWRSAMPSAVGGIKCGGAVAGGTAAINTALHVAHPRGETMTGRDRGAVVEVPCSGLFRLHFASDEATVRKKFGINDDTAVRWVGIQIEAGCDYAQRKSLTIPYVLGVEVVEGTKCSNQAIWKTPVFLSEKNKPVSIFVNVGLTASISWKRAKIQPALYRLREPLVNALTMAKAQHETRLGIISLDGRD